MRQKKRQRQKSQKWQLIHTYSGLKVELFLVIASLLTSYSYSWLNHTKIHDQFIVLILRIFIACGDLGLFFAIGYLVDFKRGTAVVYVYKILAFMSLKQVESDFDFVWKTVGVSVGLMVYYKVTLLLIVFVAGYVVEVDYEEVIVKRRELECILKQESILEQQQQKQKLFSSHQRRQLYQHNQPTSPTQQLQQTIQRIKCSLRYHKQSQFYQRLQIFYFIFYNSTVLLILFPLQQHLVDYTKGVDEKYNFLQNILMLDRVNEEILWYVNFLTVWNVVCYWAVVMVGEFYLKKKYPQLIKTYILNVPFKFVIIQGISLSTLLLVLYLTPIQTTELSTTSLLQLINLQTLITCYAIHTLLPLLIIFFLFRLYLGHVYTMNNLVSHKFNYHQSKDDAQSNLDAIFYQCITQQDLNKVKHFALDQQKQLIPRHKLKRYTEEQKLKHYVDEQTVIEVQSLFEDFLVLDLYNKLSRLLALWIFYLSLIVFLVAMNVNDTYLLVEDRFFYHMPAVLLVVGLLIVNKYQSHPNMFYPKIVLWVYKKYSQFLSARKAYNFIRLTHFYAIIFAIWGYHLYSEIFLPTHHTLELKVKETLFHYYVQQSHLHNALMTKLLTGWAQYFLTHSDQCDYGPTLLIIDTLMIVLLVMHVVMQPYFVDNKKAKNWDPILMILKIISPLYAMYVFLIQMECLQWSRIVFCVCVCVGVMFMHTNWSELERGVVRNEQGEYDE